MHDDPECSRAHSGSEKGHLACVNALVVAMLAHCLQRGDSDPERR